MDEIHLYQPVSTLLIVCDDLNGSGSHPRAIRTLSPFFLIFSYPKHTPLLKTIAQNCRSIRRWPPADPGDPASQKLQLPSGQNAQLSISDTYDRFVRKPVVGPWSPLGLKDVGANIWYRGPPAPWSQHAPTGNQLVPIHPGGIGNCLQTDADSHHSESVHRKPSYSWKPNLSGSRIRSPRSKRISWGSIHLSTIRCSR